MSLSLKKIVPWRRFWCAFGGHVTLGAHDGFLADPEGEFGKYVNPGTTTLEDLWKRPHPLILCGEPGIGKSTELKRIRDAFRNEQTFKTIWLTFREISDFSDFRRRTIDTELWAQWRLSSMRMTLVVDGIDEGLLRVPNFINELASLLKEEPVNRLHLVLACRSAEWPVEMGRDLLTLWSAEYPLSLYELCPLRQTDAEQAAHEFDLDSENFIGAVIEKSVTGLAARPVTLFFLLEEFSRHGSLPSTHRQLYELGTKRLSAELDPIRIELLRSLRKVQAKVTDAQRLKAARKIAALMLLGARSAIRMTPHPEHEGDLAISELPEETRFPTEALEETLESALFTSLGELRFGFGHQTFAECLASQYLESTPLIQLRRLLCDRDLRGEHTVPQLAELAAWIAGSRTDFCEQLLSVEPQVLLRSDVTRMQGDTKRRLVEAILAGAQKNEIFDDSGFDRFLQGLNHPTLAEQLRPIISDSSAGFIARRVAIEIAQHCKAEANIDDLLFLVVDENSPQPLRDRAASALEEIVPDHLLHVLEPLARGEVGEDPDDTIRGSALRRLIPTHWSIRDALQHLTPVKNSNLIGAYYTLQEYYLPKHITDDDIPHILDWLSSRTGLFDSLHPSNKFITATIDRAWLQLERREVLRSMVRLFQSLSVNHHHRFLTKHRENSETKLDRETRHKFVSAVLNHSDTEERYALNILHNPCMLPEIDDFEWALDQIAIATPERRSVWSEAIRHMAWSPGVLKYWDKLLLRIDEIPELALKFDWIRPWDLDGIQARKAKADWIRDKRERNKIKNLNGTRTKPDISKSIRGSIKRISEDNPDEWFFLWQHLAHENDSGYWKPWISDVLGYARWETLNSGEKDACRIAARRYLIHSAQADKDIKIDSYGAYAGRAAFSLCIEQLENDIQLSQSLIASWLHLLATPFPEDEEQSKKYFSAIYQLAPDNALYILENRIKFRGSTGNNLLEIRSVQPCWDENIRSRITKLLPELVSPFSISSGIKELFSFDPDAARSVAVKFLENSLSSMGGTFFPTSLKAATVCALIFAAKESLPVAKKLFISEPLLEACVWSSILDTHEDLRHWVNELNERELGDIFLDLNRLFPKREDPPWRGGRILRRDDIARVRDKFPNIIAARNTESACHELLRLAEALPDQETWIKWIYQDAITNLRRGRWQPPKLGQLLSILDQPETRLVKHERDLMELVVESLERLQNRLTGTLYRSVEDLWRWDGSGTQRINFNPKDEEALSDYIVRWLESDIGPRSGVVANREVQPRRGIRTDILVEAISSDSHGKIALIIEVKGCWNSSIEKALETQLIDSYLRPHNLQSGLYLVGWFLCSKWRPLKKTFLGEDKSTAGQKLLELSKNYKYPSSAFHIETFLLDCSLD